MSKTLIIRTVCDATVRETWHITVPDDWQEPADGVDLDALLGNDFTVEDEVDNEHDREITSVEVVDSSPAPAVQLPDRVAAAQAVVDLDAHVWYDTATHFNCREAEAIAALLRAFGQERTAAAFITAHGEGDDEDDQHYNPCEGHESLNGPIGNTVYCDGTCVK